MAATVQANIDVGVLTSGHGTTVSSAETGITHGRDGLQASTTTIPIPIITGTAFSWPKWLSLNVTGGTATNHLTNRTVKLGSAISTGVHAWFLAVALGAYVQPIAAIDVDSVSNGATPSGYTEILSASTTQYDNTSQITATGQNGKYVVDGLGFDNLFTGGGGTATIPTLSISYDEGP